MWDKLKSMVTGSDDAGAVGETDVEVDDHTAATRAVGGGDRTDGDSATTTGTGASGEFVGRVAGQDEGYAGLTGAEARAEAGEVNPPAS